MRVLPYVLLVAIFAAAIRYFWVAPVPWYVDESVYARLAYSLLHGHLASASTYFSIYQQYNLTTNSIYTPYGSTQSVQPWLDHPPLVGLLLVPFLAVAAGTFPQLLFIILSSVVSVLVYLVMRTEGELAALAGFVAFTLLTFYNPLLSMVFLDAGVSLFFSSTVALTLFYQRSSNRTLLYLSGVTAGLATLSKLTGVVAPFYLLLFMLYRRRQSKEPLAPFLKALAVAVLMPACWFAYGFVAEPALFWSLLHANAGISILSAHFFSPLQVLFARWSFNYTSLDQTGLDPVLVLAWFSLIYLFVSEKYPVLLLSFAALLASYVIIQYGWAYSTIPFYPYYGIAIGYLAYDVGRALTKPLKKFPGRIRGSQAG